MALLQMSIICSLLLVSTTLALSSASPVPDNAGFMRQGVDMWPGDSYRQGQERVRRQQGQGRPLRKVQQGQGRPDRRPRPQQQERFYKPKQQQQQQQQRPLKPVKRQPAPVQKVFKQEPVAERVLQAYEAEQNTVEREDQARIQEQRRIQEREEQTRIQEQARIQEQRRIQEQMRKQEPVRNQEVYNEVERSYDTRPAPSQVYERSSSAQDSLESESFAAPAEQRDIEAAVAAGAAGYAGVSRRVLSSFFAIRFIPRNHMLNHRGYPSKYMDKVDQMLTSMDMTPE